MPVLEVDPVPIWILGESKDIVLTVTHVDGSNLSPTATVDVFDSVGSKEVDEQSASSSGLGTPQVVFTYEWSPQSVGVHTIAVVVREGDSNPVIFKWKVIVEGESS